MRSHLLSLIVTSCLFVSTASAQSMSGINIGDDQAQLQKLGLQPADKQSFGPHTALKYVLPTGNEVSATFENDTGRIVYLETDWMGNPAGSYSDLTGFMYGQTTLGDIRARFRHNGMAYKSRPGIMEGEDGSIALFNSYEIANTDLVATFVTTVSADIREEMSNGSEDPGVLLPKVAKLNAIILGDKSYLDVIWGSEKLYDNHYTPIIWPVSKAQNSTQPPPQSGSFNQQHTPESGFAFGNSFVNPRDFPSRDSHRGKTVLPDFRGRDREYNTFRTRIRNGMQEGPNFAGRYSIIEIGCGTSCVFAFVGDNKTGQVMDFPLGGEAQSTLSLTYDRSSTLVTAQYLQYDNGDEPTCRITQINFDGRKFEKLVEAILGNRDLCYEDTSANMRLLR